MRARGLQHIATAVAGALVLLFVAAQWRAIHTENVNWDEFALLFRALETTRTGTVQASGRPGLVTLMLVPFAEQCANAVEAIVNARRVWLLFTLGYLAALFTLVRTVNGRRPGGAQGAALAVALLALVPVFMRWSLQVRTDQPALMFATWGAALLMLSVGRAWLSVLAGLLFAAGYLSSQKAAYVAALAAVVLAVHVAAASNARPWPWRLILARLATTAAAGLAGLLAYRLLLSLYFAPPAVFTLGAAFDIFAFYRSVFGYRAYLAMLPTLIPHLLLAGVSIGLLLRAWRSHPDPDNRVYALAPPVILLLGIAVGWFHAGAFPYFWITLGLFPAVALGVAWPAIAGVTGDRIAAAVLAAAVIVLLTSAVPAVTTRSDTQRVQREALGFIERNFDTSARGFQAEGALACRHDPSPFPAYFADVVQRRMGGPSGAAAIDRFMEDFRSRPVTFLIAHRLFPFPARIEQFWREHYVLYRDEVMIPGRRVSGTLGQAIPLDVIVSGTYRWRATSPAAGRLGTPGGELASGGTIHLDRGLHQLTLLDDVAAGWLTLAVADEPRPGGEAFYDPLVIYELDPLYPRDVFRP